MFRKLTTDNFTKNVLTLVAGTFIAQLIPVAISPVLTRLFSPENFGLFALYFSISQLLSVFITARYEYAIILPEKDEDALNVVALCISITILVSILSGLVLLPFRNAVSRLISNDQIATILWLMPLTMFAIGTYTTFNLWFNRKGRFKNVSYGKILRSSSSSLLSIGFGFSVIKSAGMIIADTFGQLSAAAFVFAKFLRSERGNIAYVTYSGIKEQARRYIHFPKYNLLSGLLEKGSGQIPVLLLSSFFGTAITGYFSLSQRVIAVPEALIAVSVGDVFRREASLEYQKNGNCRKTFVNLFKLLFLISLIPFLVLLIFSPFLFSFIFGKEWDLAGSFAQIMTIMFFLSFVVSPLSNMFIIAEKQKIDLLIQIFLFLFICLSFFAGYNIFKDPETTILFFTITYCVKYLVELYLSYSFSKGNKVLI